MSDQDFLDQINSCMDKASQPKKSIQDSEVTFNMRVSKSLRNDFDKLCRENYTDMSREVRRFMRLSIKNQKL